MSARECEEIMRPFSSSRSVFRLLVVGPGFGVLACAGPPPQHVGAANARANVGQCDASSACPSTALDDAGCQPINVAGFQPPPYHSSPAGSVACAGQGDAGGVVQAYGDACIGHAASYASCFGFDAPDASPAADCYRCLVTSEDPDAAFYGAVVVATVPLVNYAGCIERVDPSAYGASCARAISDAATCAEYACRSSCPIVDDASGQAYRACWTAAWSSVCDGYGLAANACIDSERGDGGTPAAQACFGGTTTEAEYFLIAHLLCGT